MKEYQGQAADIYALGVILFVMRFGNMPMEQATSNNAYYRLIKSNNQDKFWEAHINHSKISVSEEFKSLINSMIHPDPEARIDLPDIIVSPWLRGVTATK